MRLIIKQPIIDLSVGWRLELQGLLPTDPNDPAVSAQGPVRGAIGAIARVVDSVCCPRPRLPLHRNFVSSSGYYVPSRPVCLGEEIGLTGRGTGRTSCKRKKSSREACRNEIMSPERGHHSMGASAATAFSTQSTGSAPNDRDRSGLGSASMTTSAGSGAKSAVSGTVSDIVVSRLVETVGEEGALDFLDFLQGGQPARPAMGWS